MDNFTPDTIQRCAEHGIDIDRAYRGLLLEIRCGSPLVQRILLEMDGLQWRNGATYEDRFLVSGDVKQSSWTSNPRVYREERPLTPSERAALEHVASGLPVRGRGDGYGHTRHEHVKNARKKVGGRNLTHTVAIALRQGLIEFPAKKEEVAFRLTAGV